MGEDVKVPLVVKKEEKDGTEVIHLRNPGQKYPTPTPGVPERIFYETLYQQNPNSFMAQEYCILYGILDEEEAISVNKQVQARKLKGSGVSSPSPVKKAATVKKAGGEGRKRKSRLEDDVVVKTGLMEGGMEGVGSTAFA
ncbi:hypothetical protein Naga_100084g6 [Nannochloropsis gaditana]|uniref:Uncharacterized protein n=1 Tax=Nannochloropsis gaditana TaxID=72520 RepID=W7TKF7_9STRA|nr:hypothetical protein Naga_100084g6 [Nannochloropsis gaditana]